MACSDPHQLVFGSFRGEHSASRTTPLCDATERPALASKDRKESHMLRLRLLNVLPMTLFLCGVLFSQMNLFAQDGVRDTRKPSSTAREMLVRFVDECVEIVPGTKPFPAKFFLGSAQPSRHEIPAREIELTEPFRISRYETTQELYQVVMGQNPSRWKGPRNAVESMTIKDAAAFCERLTLKLRSAGLIEESQRVRLPTYVEWEYACRAGTTTRYCFGDEPGRNGDTDLLDSFAWHTGNAAGNDPAVGVLKPNSWGLYDVHGYLWEFVSGEEPDEVGATGGKCVIRGGAWTDRHPLLSSSAYLTVPSTVKGDQIGFRCVIASVRESKNPSKQ